MKSLKLKEIIWLFGLFISLGLIIGSWKYHLYDVNFVPRNLKTNQLSYPLVFIHVTAGVLWLLSGFWQFTSFSQKRLKVHKSIGYLYFVSALVCIFCLFVVNLTLQTKAPFGLGVYPLSIYSLICLLSGFYFIKNKNIQLHRAWMMRSMTMPLVMPIDRLNYSVASFLGLYPIESFTLTLLVLFLVELLVFKKFEWNLFTQNKVLNSLLILFVLCVAFSLLGFTAHHEMNYVNGKL